MMESQIEEHIYPPVRPFKPHAYDEDISDSVEGAPGGVSYKPNTPDTGMDKPNTPDVPTVYKPNRADVPMENKPHTLESRSSADSSPSEVTTIDIEREEEERRRIKWSAQEEEYAAINKMIWPPP
ncbi:hypothetical protein INT47_005064 [Mucor saturninus]|uniref:Uncharacterized protein n=1 Tax=Mucor saturninus TaxID=64648 RepID=A0A8H7QN07_9FUNG|nr:hypothetical protein INT47_005064 [Mucor saturninus]